MPNQQIHLGAPTDGKRRSLMHVLGHHPQYTRVPVQRNSASRFGDHGNWVQLVQESEFAARRLVGWRISEHATFQQRAVKVRDKTPRITA